MITHRVIQPKFDQNLRFDGFDNIILYDMDHIIDPAIQHDDLYNLMMETINLMRAGPDINLANIQRDEEIGARINQEDLEAYRNQNDRNKMIQSIS